MAPWQKHDGAVNTCHIRTKVQKDSGSTSGSSPYLPPKSSAQSQTQNQGSDRLGWQSKSGQGRQGDGTRARGNTGLGLGGSSRTRSPLCTGERLASRSTQRLCMERTTPSIQVQISPSGCTQLVAIAAPLGWGFTFNTDLWKTQGCLKFIQIPPP